MGSTLLLSETRAVVSADEFMQRRGVDLRTAGRYSLASRRDIHGNRREFACRTSRMSPYHMLVAAPVLGPAGERVISYFGEFGKLDGWISDISEGGFLIELATTRKARQALATKLTWLEKRQNDPSMTDGRKTQRIVPENPHSTLILADGTHRGCFVIDASPSGVAVSADIAVAIGTRLAVGRTVGEVVRCFGEGFAIKFDRVQDPQVLERMISPPKELAFDRNTVVPVGAGGDGEIWTVD